MYKNMIGAFREALDAYINHASGKGWGYGSEPTVDIKLPSEESPQSKPISAIFLLVERSEEGKVKMAHNNFIRVFSRLNPEAQDELYRDQTYACAAKILRGLIKRRNAAK